LSVKVTVTELWAPWPEGTQRGHVVSLQGDAIPAWAVGKCEPAPDDAEVDFWQGTAVGDASGEALPLIDTEGEQLAAAMAAADAQHAEEMAAAQVRASKGRKGKAEA
jgi:hypothetical protein